MSTDTLPTPTTALILTGSGYGLEIAPEALAMKAALLHSSKDVLAVRDNDESADAQLVIRRLAGVRNLVEKSRKEIKEPVLAIGKLIDTTAKDYLREIEQEESRIRNLVGEHAAAVARAKAEKEAEERRAFEAARAAREEAQRAADAAANTGKIADVIAAKQAERERQEALATRMDASAEVAATKVAEGVRFAWDFEVVDMDRLADARRDLVTIEPKRAAILNELKCFTEEGGALEKYCRSIGVRAFKKPVVSSR